MFNLEKIHRNIYVIGITLICTISSILTFFYYVQSATFLEESEIQRGRELERNIERILFETVEFYKYRAIANIHSPGVLNAIKENNKEKLYQLTLDRWKVLQKENPYLTIMQFHSANGRSLLRVHSPNIFGDSIFAKRPMVAQIHASRREVVGFETGVYFLAYRTIFPIFDDNTYLGALEFGVDPDYINYEIKKMYNVDASLFVLKNSLAPNKECSYIVNGYCTALSHDPNADKIKALGQDYIFPKYQRLTYLGRTYSVYAFTLTAYNNEKIGKVVIFEDITQMTQQLERTLIWALFITFIVVGLAIFVLRYYLKSVKKHFQFLREEEEAGRKYLRTVLDAQSNIVVVTDGYNLIDTNKAFFDFFFDFSSLEHFKKQYECICDLFIDEEGFLSKSNDNGIRWIDIVIENTSVHYRVKIKDMHGEIHIFEVSAKSVLLGDKERKVAVFNDITEMMEMKKALLSKVSEEENLRKHKETLLLQQSKMAAMGEMIGAISHQWRQPLNALAVLTQDILDAFHYGDLSETYIENFEQNALRQIDFMSQTIEDFRQFFKPDKEKSLLPVKMLLKEVTELLRASLVQHRVKVVIDGDELATIEAYSNELKQAFLNLINNAKDALLSVSEERWIHIHVYRDNTLVVIEIEDNGLGFSDINNLFIPYFTTKGEHGTGIGLVMTKQIIEKISGTIEACHGTQGGALFRMTFPFKKK